MFICVLVRTDEDHWSRSENLFLCISGKIHALMLNSKTAVRYQIATNLEQRPDESVYDYASKAFPLKPKRPICDLQMMTSDW